MIYFNELIMMLLYGLIFLIATIIFSIFSPFGIIFAVFSIAREKTNNIKLKKISLIFQIIMAALNFIVGLLVIFALLLINNRFNTELLFIIIPIFLGLGFVMILEIGIIIWQSYRSKNTAQGLEMLSKNFNKITPFSNLKK